MQLHDPVIPHDPGFASSQAGTRSSANRTSESIFEGSAKVWIEAALFGVAGGSHRIVSLSSRRNDRASGSTQLRDGSGRAA